LAELKSLFVLQSTGSRGGGGGGPGGGGTLYAHNCDITKGEDIMRVLRWTRARLGAVDILINNALAHKGKSHNEFMVFAPHKSHTPAFSAARLFAL